MAEKKFKKSRKKQPVTILIIIFLCLYIPSLIHWIRGGNITTDILRMGAIEDAIHMEGIVIRDSQVFKSPFDGKFIPDAEEGERMAANSRIATAYKNSSIELLNQLDALNQKIIDAQNEKSKNQQLFSGDIEKIEAEIAQNTRELINEANLNRLFGTERIQEKIKKLTLKKSEIIGGMITGDTYINSLKGDRDKLQNQVNTGKKDIVSAPAGIVSYFVDEYDEVLTPKAIEEITPAYLNAIDVNEGSRNINRELTAEKPFAKIIRDSGIYIAAVMEEKNAQLLKKGDSITVRINDIGSKTNGTVFHVSEAADGKVVLVVFIDRFIRETTAFRKLDVEIIRNYHEGYKVPLKSLIQPDYEKGTAQIALVRFSVVNFVDVVIAGKDEGSAIIANPKDKNTISLYNTYIVNPNNIKEGQIVNQ